VSFESIDAVGGRLTWGRTPLRTFREKSNSEEILQILSEIAENLEQDLKRTGFSARTVVVKYKVSVARCSTPKEHED